MTDVWTLPEWRTALAFASVASRSTELATTASAANQAA